MSTTSANDLHRASRTRLAWSAMLCCVLSLSMCVAAGAQEASAGLGAGLVSPQAASLGGGDLRLPGSVTGTVKDVSGATIAGAVVTLAAEGAAGSRSSETDADGMFVFAGVGPGAYRVTVAVPGFAMWTGGGSVVAGESLTLSEIAMALASAKADVNVVASRTEIAEAQISLEEKQRILGVFPNFYASYIWNAEPLNARQKYKLAWRFAADPVAVAMAATIAGTEQSQDGFSGYGQGAQGYAKRLGATYADGFTSTLFGQAILPALLHQDPRYFVKGTGTVRARTEYALAMTVMCRGDNGHWQVNASNMLGNVASASLSNVYYPASNRHGALLTVQNSLISTMAGAFGNLMQEFVLRRMTPNMPDYGDGR